MRIVFIGTGEIGLPVLKFLRASDEHQLVGVVTQPDKPVGRAQQIEAPPIKLALTDSAIPILQPERIKREEAVTAIRALSPDAIVVMAYGQILPRSILDIPPFACLNLHASLLPRHRGAAPIQAAIASGDFETGITVMYMNEGLDTGDMLLQSRLPILPNETGGSLHDRLAEIAPATLKEALTQLANGEAPRVPQIAQEATYAPKLEREDGKIDWTESALVIERKIRAFHPWPGSFTILRDDAGCERKMKIFAATVLDHSNSNAGRIEILDGRLTIGTRDGVLEIGAVQMEGKKRMSAADFVRGHAWLANSAVEPARLRAGE